MELPGKKFTRNFKEKLIRVQEKSRDELPKGRGTPSAKGGKELAGGFPLQMAAAVATGLHIRGYQLFS